MSAERRYQVHIHVHDIYISTIASYRPHTPKTNCGRQDVSHASGPLGQEQGRHAERDQQENAESTGGGSCEEHTPAGGEGERG